MVNPVWVGTLMFGRVPVGVRLYSARERRGPVLHQFERGTADRIRYVRVNERTGEEVAGEDVVRGARTGVEDEYVVLEPEELEEILPHGSRTMELTGFLSQGAVDALWYASTYYVAPRAAADAKAYQLLYTALEQTRRTGVATIVLRDREYPVLIEPNRGVLSASTLWWPDEVREPDDVMPPVAHAALAKSELELARELVRSLSIEWDPEDYSDSYGQRLTELVRAKARGRTFTHRPEQAVPPEDADGLGEALRQSLPAQRTQGARSRGPRASTGAEGAGRAREPRGAGARGARAERRGEGRATKRELLQRASELDVPGRSKMSRDQLEEAVGLNGADSGR
ncbi:Ku protein [Nocardiopsis dassonvillei]|uniref:non-homologous end joining protein Ku n=1 Tax=Nocardiopsis dassonvillei TaxID=2014 RepID=UPI00200CACF5|nr:Ku protein [Nocardiopsis dassonvillei]MCK9869055.1 Ku protein [Nocardiopsis dassonvillei]